LAVEENVEIVNKGAFLKGSFSRLDFQMDRRGMKQPVVRSFKVNCDFYVLNFCSIILHF